MSAPVAAAAAAFIPIVGLSADSSRVDICRLIPDLHTFHDHRKHFHSDAWSKLYKCVVQFSIDRQYGPGHLSVAYLHYRLRTLYRLCGEGAPHPDERPDQSREEKKSASKRRRLLEQSRDDDARADIDSSPPGAATSPPLPRQELPLQPRPPATHLSTLSRYHDAHPDTQSLTSLFRIYAQVCSPQHGADFDMSSLPEKRARKPPSLSGVACLPQPDRSVPAAVAPGYAECTRKAFDRLCAWLCDEAPPHLRMTSDSVFLDVGSGYGKCVVQARLRASVRKSIGIEYVAVRYLMGMKMLTERIPSQFQSIHARLGDCVELLQGDATDEQFVDQYAMATHVFIFDWVFNAVGKQGVLNLIEQSSQLRVLVCCRRPDELPHFHLLHQMMLSTGKQHPTAYLYARRNGDESTLEHSSSSR